jgi:hypothetical protein
MLALTLTIWFYVRGAAAENSEEIDGMLPYGYID